MVRQASSLSIGMTDKMKLSQNHCAGGAICRGGS